MPKKPHDRLLTNAELVERFGINHTISTRYRLERQGQFPKRVRVSPQRYAYRQAEILQWIEDRSLERRKVTPGLRPLIKTEQSIVLGDSAVQVLAIVNAYLNAAREIPAPEVSFPDGARLVSHPRFQNWALLSLPRRGGMDIFCVHDGRWIPYDGPRPLAGYDVLLEQETLIDLLKSGLASGRAGKDAALRKATNWADAMAGDTCTTLTEGDWWRMAPEFTPDTAETTVVYTRFDPAAAKPKKDAEHGC